MLGTLISCILTKWRVHASELIPGFVTFVGDRNPEYGG